MPCIQASFAIRNPTFEYQEQFFQDPLRQMVRYLQVLLCNSATRQASGHFAANPNIFGQVFQTNV